jgi:hypothetical protein
MPRSRARMYVVCECVCCEQRENCVHDVDQTPPMVFRYDVIGYKLQEYSFRDVVYFCDSGAGFPKIRLLRQDGGNRTGMIRSFGRCRRFVVGSEKDFLSVCSSELEHRG